MKIGYEKTPSKGLTVWSAVLTLFTVANFILIGWAVNRICFNPVDITEAPDAIPGDLLKKIYMNTMEVNNDRKLSVIYLIMSCSFTFLLPVVGCFTQVLDYFLTLCPPGRKINDKLGFKLKFPLCILPAMIASLYASVVTIASFWIQPDSFLIKKFSITGAGYTKPMWTTQITALLVLLAFLFLFYEAVANAGIVGALVRIPLHIVTNVAMLEIITLILMLAAKLLIGAVTVVLCIFTLFAFLFIMGNVRIVYKD